MRLFLLFIFGFVLSVSAFDPLEYIRQEHDKLFFGLGGGMSKGLNSEYSPQFPDYNLRRVVLEAGIGDYPFVADIRYCVDWDFGFGDEMVSGTGARLVTYQVIPALRTYLFWKHPRLKTYILSGVIGEQEELTSTTSAATDRFRSTDGVRYGLLMGVGFDIAPADFSFIDLELGYKYVGSDIFEKKELWIVNLVFNIGK